MTQNNDSRTQNYRVAIIGARGYVGHKLIKLLCSHPHAELIAVSSRSAAGVAVYTQVPECENKELVFTDLQAHEMASVVADVVFLALPNNVSQAYVEVIRSVRPDTVIIDLSFDHRLDSEPDNDYPWAYGLSEVNSDLLKHAKRISNPGCYATAAQLALYPLRDMITGTPSIFGVSGYSGAGSTPNDKNNPDTLRDNLLPYALAGHLHESEISKHIGHNVNFMPHVAAYFSGLSTTVTCDVNKEMTADSVYNLFANVYQDHPLIKVQKQTPYPRDIANQNGAIVGGFAVDQRNNKNIRLVAVLDNLLKGAAVQAVQNMNLALGLDSLVGVNL